MQFMKENIGNLEKEIRVKEECEQKVNDYVQELI